MNTPTPRRHQGGVWLEEWLGSAIPPLDRRGLVALLAIVFVFGVSIRFFHLGQKVVWTDESIATMRIVGVTEGEIVTAVDKLTTMGDLHALTHPEILTRPASSTIDSLRAEDPQHPPLYYLIARSWAKMFGVTTLRLRILSALIGVLAIPCTYWLCSELFQHRGAAWAGAVFAAVSPVGVLYSQEIREYSLWLVATLASTALLIRLLRRPSTTALAIYALSVAASLYVFPSAAFVIAAHGLVILFSDMRVNDKARALIAQLFGVTAFAPWLLVILANKSHIDAEMANFTQAASTPGHVVRVALALIRVNMLDFNGEHPRLVYVVGMALSLVCGYAVYMVRRNTPLTARLVVWTMIPCVSLPYILLDILYGGERTWQTRYFIPMFVAIDLALVWLAVSKLRRGNSARSRNFWAAIFSLVLVARIASCLVIGNTDTWWSKYNIRPAELAARLDRTVRPLILGDGYVTFSIVLSEYLAPKTEIALRPRCYTCVSPLPKLVDFAAVVPLNEVRDVFLVAPSERQRLSAESYWRHESPAARYHCLHVLEGCSEEWSFYY